ncbi:helix-turn-helix domain-containing protein [Pseudooceanicola sp. 216_PA32_1]|jgi:transcriptional regulator with XRE-family HTH domain|uniref:Helix-turn-helix domain-containing protein n=1 Tax=Pseudooceanicola pacificus TaxID=2676438 RepID=A0A844W764_9RHOB|nr:XRE family transcriptional regulator [Pseudooceanicola pacificus]MWB76553.1 helix-turn-helix domain-containing protein [Pseudooceanicola pacificus]
MDTLTTRLAERLRALRRERGHSLDQLTALSGVSRGTLSRLENGEVSPTAEVLGKLCAAYGLPMSRLMRMIEGAPAPLVPLAAQEDWIDPATGFRRRAVSPPAAWLSGEVIEGHLPPDTVIRYAAPPVMGLEHHLILREGALEMEIGATTHSLRPGDCLRYVLDGPTAFRGGPEGALYLLFMV